MTDKQIKKYILIGIAAIFVSFAYALLKYFNALEILSKLNEQNISYWLIFAIGLLASFHCIGMCGGLVVTYTASSKTRQPHFQYNLGRFISYSLTGAVLGGFGSFFAVNPTFTGLVTLGAGIFMILMGLNLMFKNKWLNRLKISTPKFIAKFLFNNKDSKKPKGPFIIGLLTGFMPCGPLQAMQLYALASGSITRGAISMGIYALGTIPLMFGFGSFISAIKSEKVKQVMKISGIVVILLGLFMLNRGLTNFGYGYKSLLSDTQTSNTEYLVEGSVSEYQTVNMDLTYAGYEPNVLYVKKGIPVRWVINVKQMSGCTDEIVMPDYDISKKLVQGENIIEFTPQEEGEIKFSCWMQMVWGKFVVTEGEVDPSAKNLEQEVIEAPSGSGCSGDGSCGGGCGDTSCGCKSRIKSN